MLNEETLRMNFTLAYEIIDEAIVSKCTGLSVDCHYVLCCLGECCALWCVLAWSRMLHKHAHRVHRLCIACIICMYIRTYVCIRVYL